MVYPIVTPPKKKEIEQAERDRKAEMDLHLLMEAEKIKRDPERFESAMARKKAMQKELEQIQPRIPPQTPETA
jgi:hypothetical protein